MARSKIIEFGGTAIPILDAEHRPAGVVSLRDLDCVGHVEPRTPVAVVRSDATLDEGARKLADSRIQHLVVVDPDGVAVGTVSRHRLRRRLRARVRRSRDDASRRVRRLLSHAY